MSLDTRLKKLETKARDDWQNEWNKFFEELLNKIPYKAHAVWDKQEQLLSDARTMDNDTRQAIDKHILEETQSLYTLLDLEPSVWEAWSKHIDETPEWEDPINLAFTPRSVPYPPANPLVPWSKVQTLEFPLDFVGVTRLHFLWYLAIAVTLWEMYETP